MSDFAARLKEERTRLGLSQATFAEKTGIHRNTQIKYESGEREPDIVYLQAIEKTGADGQYIMTGVRKDEGDLRELAVTKTLLCVLGALGMGPTQSNELIQSAFEIGKEKASLFHAENYRLLTEVVNTLVKARMDSLIALDAPILTGTIEAFETSVQNSGLVISPEKKAQAIAMLFRAFKACGQIDQSMIDDAVKLATD